MKKLKFAPVLLLLTALLAFSPADVCESYFATKVGTKWEQTSYDSKNKVSGRSVGEVIAVDAENDGFKTTMMIEAFDQKDNSMNKGEVVMECKGDKFYINVSDMLTKGMAGIEGAEVEMDNVMLEFPSHPVAGQTLPDMTSTITVKLNGTPIMTMSVKTTNRKIEGFETITTTAGTFDCVKYSSDITATSIMTGKSRSVMWMAKNVGSVKSETYDDKGKLTGSQVLTKFEE